MLRERAETRDGDLEGFGLKMAEVQSCDYADLRRKGAKD